MPQTKIFLHYPDGPACCNKTNVKISEEETMPDRPNKFCIFKYDLDVLGIEKDDQPEYIKKKIHKMAQWYYQKILNNDQGQYDPHHIFSYETIVRKMKSEFWIKMERRSRKIKTLKYNSSGCAVTGLSL